MNSDQLAEILARASMARRNAHLVGCNKPDSQTVNTTEQTESGLNETNLREDADRPRGNERADLSRTVKSSVSRPFLAEPPPQTANDGLTQSRVAGAGGQPGIVNRYFSVVIDPVPAPRQTRSDLWKKRPCVVRYRAYRDALKAAYAKLLKADPAPARAPDELTCAFFFPMPTSWSKSKKEKMSGQRHQQKPDIDNCIKATADALWDDDSHISSMHGIKYWGVEGSVIISMTWLES